MTATVHFVYSTEVIATGLYHGLANSGSTIKEVHTDTMVTSVTSVGFYHHWGSILYLGILFGVCSLASLFCSLLTVYHIFLISINETTRERIKDIWVREGGNPYSKQVLLNVLNFLRSENLLCFSKIGRRRQYFQVGNSSLENEISASTSVKMGKIPSRIFVHDSEIPQELETPHLNSTTLEKEMEWDNCKELNETDF